jgi:hypothetical protein
MLLMLATPVAVFIVAAVTTPCPAVVAAAEAPQVLSCSLCLWRKNYSLFIRLHLQSKCKRMNYFLSLSKMKKRYLHKFQIPLTYKFKEPTVLLICHRSLPLCCIPKSEALFLANMPLNNDCNNTTLWYIKAADY